MALYSSRFGLYAQKNNIITDFLEEGTAWVEVRPSFYFFEALELERISEAQAQITYYYITGDTIIGDVKFWTIACKVLHNHHFGPQSVQYPRCLATRVRHVSRPSRDWLQQLKLAQSHASRIRLHDLMPTHSLKQLRRLFRGSFFAVA